MKKPSLIPCILAAAMLLSAFSADKYRYLKDPVTRTIHVAGCPLASPDSIEYSSPASAMLTGFRPCTSCDHGIETTISENGLTIYTWRGGTPEEVRVTASYDYYYDSGSHLSHLPFCSLLPRSEETGEITRSAVKRFHSVFELLDGSDTCGPCPICQPFYISDYDYEPGKD